MDKIYSVTELAQELGSTPRAMRYYEDRGLITPQRVGNTRVYSHCDRARMILILRGKRLGFSLRDIQDLLDLYVVDTSQVEQMQLLVTKVRARIRQLKDQRQALELSLAELQDIEKLTADALTARSATIFLTQRGAA